ncbi:UTP--glucose-1-phosphate uridylyltransferase [Cooperia oncophora]
MEEIPPMEKELMCGDTGVGAMATTQMIATVVATIVRNRFAVYTPCDSDPTLNKTFGVDVPLVLMNSFNTEEDTKKVLKKYANVKVSVYTFCQSQYPRINRETLMPIAKSLNDADQECWYPPGHGNFYEAFYNSGLIDKFIADGKEVKLFFYCFLSNIDNMGATVDFAILNFLLSPPAGHEHPEFLMEVTNKTRADVKGGTLIQYENRLMLLEIAQVPKDYVDEFKSISKFRIFNTNNLWAKLSAIKRVVENNELEMEVIVNPNISNVALTLSNWKRPLVLP